MLEHGISSVTTAVRLKEVKVDTRLIFEKRQEDRQEERRQK
jgi:hypothetical protein